MSAPSCEGAPDCKADVIIGLYGRLLCLKHWREAEPKGGNDGR
jgi:hypothetical protein